MSWFFAFILLQTEYFQDDLYCDTLVHWEPALTAEEWLAGKDAIQRRISLRPEGMKPCVFRIRNQCIACAVVWALIACCRLL